MSRTAVADPNSQGVLGCVAKRAWDQKQYCGCEAGIQGSAVMPGGGTAHWVQCASRVVEGAVAAAGTGTGSEEVANKSNNQEGTLLVV